MMDLPIIRVVGQDLELGVADVPGLVGGGFLQDFSVLDLCAHLVLAAEKKRVSIWEIPKHGALTGWSLLCRWSSTLYSYNINIFNYQVNILVS